jgi:toxin ParE1/3/4
VERLITVCQSLSGLPSRGAPRDDLDPGIRMLGFERRVAIFYRITDDVEIVRVLYAGRDVGAVFTEKLEP